MGVYDSHVILSCYYRTPVDRDFSKMTELDCIHSQVVTHYGGNKFGNLNDVATGPNGEVVIVDNDNRCVVVLDNKLNFMKSIGQGRRDDILVLPNFLNLIGRGSSNSKYFTPNSVAVTDNVIAVSDRGSHQVKKYTLQGKLLSIIGYHGDEDGQFNYPRGLAFDKNKLLYIVDGDNYRIQVFQQDDSFAFSFGSKGSKPGQFQYPVRIAIDPDNHVLATDLTNKSIHLFTHNGQFKQRIQTDSPYAITISPTGYLITGHYVDDNNIRIWNHTYELINQFGKKGSKQGEFYSIYGIA